MKKIINALWNGDISPKDQQICNTEEMKQLLSYMARHSQTLNTTLKGEDSETFEKYVECSMEYMSLYTSAVFEYAFKLGAELMLEILKK